VTGLTVLPGFIDSHVHLFPTGSSSGIDSDAALEQFIRDELPARLRNYLERGVTTVFSVGDAWPAVRELRRRIEAGEISAPRLLMTASQSTIASHIVHISPNLPTRK
jgi:imidazolonepropionase-like amidohydrolase